MAEEDRNDGCARTSMDGMELIKVTKSFNQIVNKMEEVGIPNPSQFRWDGFKVAMHKALAAFNAAAALALADLWEEDKSHEMGENFRRWADAIIDDLGPEVGLPYAGRSYLDILPAHWLCEKDHLEQHARENWLTFGVSPGVNSDAPCEAGEPQIPVYSIRSSVVYPYLWLRIGFFCSESGLQEDADKWAGEQCWWDYLES